MKRTVNMTILSRAFPSITETRSPNRIVGYLRLFREEDNLTVFLYSRLEQVQHLLPPVRFRGDLLRRGHNLHTLLEGEQQLVV